MSTAKKKISLCACVLAVALTAILCIAVLPRSGVLTAKAATGAWTPTVENGVIDDRIAYGYGDGNIGHTATFGSKLIEDETAGINRGAMEFSLCAHWGDRFSYQYPMDMRDFRMQLDLSNMNEGGRVLLIFSHTKGGYAGLGDGKTGDGLLVVVYRGVDNQWGFIVTNTDHNISMKTVTPDINKAIEFDSGSTGITITHASPVFDLSFKQESAGGAFKFGIDENQWSIPYAEMESVFFDVSNVYLCLGAMGYTETIRINNITEPRTSAYEKIAQPMLANIKNYVNKAKAAGNDAAKIKEAVAAFTEVDTLVLRSNDVNATEQELKEANEALRAGKQQLASASLKEVALEDIENYEAVIAKANDNASASIAESLRQEVLFDLELLQGNDKADVQTAFAAANEKMAEKLLEIIGGYVTRFENAAAAIDSSATLVELENVRDEIYVHYGNETLEEASGISALSARIAAANAKLSAIGKLSGWTASEGARIYTADGKTAQFSSVNGMNESLTDNTGSTVVRNEKVDVTDYSTTIRLKRHGLAVDREMDWVALGVMQKPNNFFINNDVTSDEGAQKLQGNLGFFMYLVMLPSNKLRVTVFILKSSTIALYDGYRGDMIIDYVEGSDLNIKIHADNKDRNTYADIYLNDAKFTGNNVRCSELRGVFGDSYEGTFMLTHARSYYDVTMTQFNGKNLSGGTPVSSDEGNKGEPGKKGGCGSAVATPAAIIIPVFAILSAALLAVLKRRSAEEK